MWKEQRCPGGVSGIDLTTNGQGRMDMRMSIMIGLSIALFLIAPASMGAGTFEPTDESVPTRDTRAGPSLNFTYLNHDAASFGSTAFRVWDNELVIFVEAFPNETACMWNPESIRRADIILQAPHGHMSHYDPDEVACVAKNTGAYVVGNSELQSDMIFRGVDTTKLVELNPGMGQKATKTISDLNVRITSYGMEHTWMSGVQDNTFLIEMPSGVKWYHGTCSSGSNTETYMANAPELKGLDVMILDFDLVKPTTFNNYYPEYIIKDHDYQTFQATVYNHKQQNVGTLSHNQTFQYTKPDHPPEVVGTEWSPLDGDMNTNYTFTVLYKYWYDRPATRSDLILDGAVVPLAATQTTGYRTGVPYAATFRMAPGDHSYHLVFEVDGRSVRVPASGEIPTPHVNHIPELLEAGHEPQEGDTDSTYTFHVTYRDAENQTAVQSQVFIDGASRLMNVVGAMNYSKGAIFKYSTKLSIGNHSYYFLFSDGRSEVRSPKNGELSSIEVARANYPPILSQGGVDLPKGSRRDTFTFSVRYKDAHGDVPVKRLLVLDGSEHEMTMVGTDLKKGVEFRFSTALVLGRHSFHFLFDDGKYEVRLPAEEASEFSGPLVENTVPQAVIYSPGPSSDHSDLVPIVFNATGTYDDDGDALTLNWSSDISGALGTGYQISALLEAGTHLIELTAADGLGGTSTANITIFVIHYEVVLVPEIEMLPQAPEEGATVEVIFKVTNTGNLKAENISLEVLLDDSPLKRDLLASLLPHAWKSFTTSFTAVPGEHALVLRTTGASDETIGFEVQIRASPVAIAGVDRNTLVGEVVDFDASASSSPGQLVHYHWDFDDGSNATGRMVSHIFMAPGIYNVTLTIKDELGKTGTDTLRVIVAPVTEEETDKDVGEEGSNGLVIAIIVIVVLLTILILGGIAFLTMRKRKGGGAHQVPLLVQQEAVTAQLAQGSPQTGLPPASGPLSTQPMSELDQIFAPTTPVDAQPQVVQPVGAQAQLQAPQPTGPLQKPPPQPDIAQTQMEISSSQQAQT